MTSRVSPGAIVRPSGESFGTSLTNAITTIVDREHLTARSTPGADRQDTPPFMRDLRRTLAQ